MIMNFIKKLWKPVYKLEFKVSLPGNEPFFNQAKEIAELIFKEPCLVNAKGYLIWDKKCKDELRTLKCEIEPQ